MFINKLTEIFSMTKNKSKHNQSKAKANNLEHEIGAYVIIGGIAISVLAGTMGTLNVSWVTALLFALGLCAGVLHLHAKNDTEFLIACIAILIASGTSSIGFITGVL